MIGTIWWNGKLGSQADATTRLTSETAMRGINVFEGIRAYWQQEHGRFAVVSLEEHLDRLRASLELLSLPAQHLVAPLRDAIGDLLAVSPEGTDYYLRPTIYLEDGPYTQDPEECAFGSFVSIREAPLTPPTSCWVSTYRHVPSTAFPSRAKSGASYSMFRLARLEAVSQGYEEAIVLDAHNLVTETGGASVFVVSDDVVMTPDLGHDILDSITRRHAIAIVRERLARSVVECALDSDDLRRADEVFLAGTLDEIRIVRLLDRHPGQLNSTVGAATRERYLAICRGHAEPLTEQMLAYIRRDGEHHNG